MLRKSKNTCYGIQKLKNLLRKILGLLPQDIENVDINNFKTKKNLRIQISIKIDYVKVILQQLIL